VSLGERICTESGDAGAVDASLLVDAPWSTGFEDGFCGYAAAGGFCVASGPGAYGLVTSPVHSGRFAAAFTVSASSADDAGIQSRCVRQGAFPAASYYGAWYYLPATATNTGDWNLFHFQSGTPGQTLNGMWDVSLASAADGGLSLYLLYDFTTSRLPPPAQTQWSVPIGRWFHIEVYFKRASDNTGELALWQDGTRLADLSGVETDSANWGEWFVGNLASALKPSLSTLYVDDVTISPDPTPVGSSGP
jgi:hypothetical protein